MDGRCYACGRVLPVDRLCRDCDREKSTGQSAANRHWAPEAVERTCDAVAGGLSRDDILGVLADFIRGQPDPEEFREQMRAELFNLDAPDVLQDLAKVMVGALNDLIDEGTDPIAHLMWKSIRSEIYEESTRVLREENEWLEQLAAEDGEEDDG